MVLKLLRKFESNQDIVNAEFARRKMPPLFHGAQYGLIQQRPPRWNDSLNRNHVPVFSDGETDGYGPGLPFAPRAFGPFRFRLTAFALTKSQHLRCWGSHHGWCGFLRIRGLLNRDDAHRPFYRNGESD